MILDLLKMIASFVTAGVVVYFIAAGFSVLVRKWKRRTGRTKSPKRMVEEAKEGKHLKSSKSLDFSKLMLSIQTGLSVSLVIACIIIKVKLLMDVSDLITIATASFGFDGAWGGFYLWKAKNENRAKYAQQFVLEFADKYGFEAAVQIAQIVLQD